MSKTPGSHQAYGSWLDPRPDLAVDADLWAAVLAEALRCDPFPEDARSLFGLLHGLRCGGASLAVTGAGSLRLDYSALVTPGVWTDNELRTNWLLPAADLIKKVFVKVERRLKNDGALLQAAVGM